MKTSGGGSALMLEFIVSPSKPYTHQCLEQGPVPFFFFWFFGFFVETRPVLDNIKNRIIGVKAVAARTHQLLHFFNGQIV